MTNGGAEKVACILAGEINRNDFEVELILLEKDDFYKPPKEIKVTYLSNQTENEKGIKKFFSLFYFSIKLKKLISQRNISFIQSHIYRSNFVNILACLLGSKHKSQIINHGILSRHLGEGIRGAVVIFLTKLLYPRADQCILVSNAMKVDLEGHVDSKNTKVINNPFSFAEIKNSSKIDLLEKKFSFKEEKKYLICAGRCIKIKRFDVIIKSLEYLSSEVELIILGDGEERIELEKLTNKLGLNSRVHCLGNVKNPFNFFKNSDIFVLSSETEGFPMVLIEAMACGLPIIATDCISGPREILAAEDSTLEGRDYQKTNYGILTRIGDPECLASAVSLLLNDCELTEELKINSRERILEYSTENIVSQYIESIKLII